MNDAKAEGRWRDADRDIYYETEMKGRRISVRADAAYLNALEAENRDLKQQVAKLEAECLGLTKAIIHGLPEQKQAIIKAQVSGLQAEVERLLAVEQAQIRAIVAQGDERADLQDQVAALQETLDWASPPARAAAQQEESK